MKQTQIKSQSDRSSRSAQNFFVPSLANGILYLLLGTSLLFAYNSSSIIRWLGNGYLNSAGHLSLNFNILNSGLSHSFSTAFGGRLGQIIIWSLVGAAAYIALWFLKNILNSFENDVIIDHYLHPSNYDRAGYWGSALAGIIFFGAMLIVLIGYSFAILRVILPGAASLTASATSHFHLVNSLVYILLCILISALSLYIWVLVAKTVAHLWRLL